MAWLLDASLWLRSRRSSPLIHASRLRNLPTLSSAYLPATVEASMIYRVLFGVFAEPNPRLPLFVPPRVDGRHPEGRRNELLFDIRESFDDRDLNTSAILLIPTSLPFFRFAIFPSILRLSCDRKFDSFSIGWFSYRGWPVVCVTCQLVRVGTIGICI